MSKMDDEKNRMIFETLQEECQWKDEPKFGALCNLVICHAGNVPCRQNYCMPLKFALYFNRPEIKHE